MKQAMRGLAIVSLLLVTACGGMGPPTLARDRFDYVNAVSDSWRRQMLLNVVKLRYYDTPVFLEVASIINQYSLEGEVNLGAAWSDLDGNSQVVGGSGRYADRPTITYAPLSGEKFAQNLMVPIPVTAVLYLIQAGYPVEYVFRIIVQSINGVDNRFGGQLMRRTADPLFKELLDHLARIQRAGGLSMGVKEEGEGRAVVMFFRSAQIDAMGKDLEAVVRILGIDPDTREFEVVYGSVAGDPSEIVIETRSIIQILVELGSLIEVPEKDLEEGRTYRTLADSDDPTKFSELIQIHSGNRRPEEANVSIQYRGKWFWIDDRDVPRSGRLPSS